MILCKNQSVSVDPKNLCPRYTSAHLSVGTKCLLYTVRCGNTVIKVFRCHLRQHYHVDRSTPLHTREFFLTSALKSFKRIADWLVLTLCRESLISPTYSGYSAFGIGRISVSKRGENSYNFTLNMRILSPIGIPPLTQLHSCRLTSVRRLNQIFTPLLGRTRSRGQCWAAIRLSHRPEPSGRVVHEEVGG